MAETLCGAGATGRRGSPPIDPMAMFPSWRRRVLDRFEPRDGGFAYRENIHARAVMVTAEEREALLYDHDQRRSLFWVLLALDPFVAALAGFLVYAVDPNMTVVAIAVHGTFFLVYPIPLAVWVDAGCRALARGRPAVDEGLEKAEIERRRIGRLSWAGIVGNTTLAAAWFVMTVRDGGESAFWRVLFGSLLIVGFVLNVREAWAKVRQRQVRRRDGMSCHGSGARQGPADEDL